MGKEIFISTESVNENQRIDLWRSITKPLFDTSPYTEIGSLSLAGSIRTRPIGSLMTAYSTFNKQKYNRDRRVVLQSELDSYLVQLVTSGELAGDFNGVRASAEAGDIFILDLTQTLQNRVTDGERINFVLPRQPLEKAISRKNLHGVVLKGHWPITKLVLDYLTGLHAIGGQLPAVHADAAHEAAVMLIATALRGDALDAVAGHSVLKIALRQRILAFIDQNINLPELSPEFIMRRFHVSRSHLYRTFADDGGVAKLLRDKRLDAAFMELARTDSSSTMITEVGYRLGFSSGNHFLRAFRARFGMTPSQVRQERNLPQKKGETTSERLQTYYADLYGQALKK